MVPNISEAQVLDEHDSQVAETLTLGKVIFSEGGVCLFFILPFVVYFFLVASIPAWV